MTDTQKRFENVANNIMNGSVQKSSSSGGNMARSKPSKAPTRLPCGCAAMGTRTQVNRESLTIMGGKKVCRHGKVWELAWVETGNIKGKPGRPRRTLASEPVNVP